MPGIEAGSVKLIANRFHFINKVNKMKVIFFLFNNFKISNFGEEFLSSFPFYIFEKFVNKVIFLFFYNIFFSLLILVMASHIPRHGNQHTK